MVDLIQAYRAIDKSLCDVAESIVPLKVLPFENKKQKVILKDSPFNLTKKDYVLQEHIVVAHNLNQYKNIFYTIQLESSDVPWIDFLINDNEDEYGDYEYGGLERVSTSINGQ